jgi:hypothetical protein
MSKEPGRKDAPNPRQSHLLATLPKAESARLFHQSELFPLLLGKASTSPATS